MLKLKIQTVLYENKPAVIHKLLTSLLSLRRPEDCSLWLGLGDCSGRPLLEAGEIAGWQDRFTRQGWSGLSYAFFNQNLGFGQGHNRLFFEAARPDRLILINPDGVAPFHLLERLLRFSETRPGWGIIEPRQVPFEHPKVFDPLTFETSFASGACAMFDASLFADCGGFDETFFMYAEDVDLSWRIRAAGRKIFLAPDTFYYHAKQVDKNGLIVSAHEKYYSRLSWLILRTRYGRPDLVEPALAYMQAHPEKDANARLLADWAAVSARIVPATPAQLAAATFQANGSTVPFRWSYV